MPYTEDSLALGNFHRWRKKGWLNLPGVWKTVLNVPDTGILGIFGYID